MSRKEIDDRIYITFRGNLKMFRYLYIDLEYIECFLFSCLGPDRLDGFYIYISDTFNEKHPNSGHQCFHDNQDGYVNTFQNITCDYPGRYVVIYNQRFGSDAILELCEVEVHGKINY